MSLPQCEMQLSLLVCIQVAQLLCSSQVLGCALQNEPVVRLYDILRKEDVDYVSQEDLKSMMAGILLSHPGLEFLQETPEFQDRYCLHYHCLACVIDHCATKLYKLRLAGSDLWVA